LAEEWSISLNNRGELCRGGFPTTDFTPITSSTELPVIRPELGTLAILNAEIAHRMSASQWVCFPTREALGGVRINLPCLPKLKLVALNWA
jgi:hypothetical protein